jgi:two-component system, NarL family, response regulator YdfI
VIRVYIVAASPLARAGLENLLAVRSVSIVGSASSLESVAEQMQDLAPDVVLLDASGSSSEALDQMMASGLAEETTLVVLLDNVSPAMLTEAMRSGVRAVLPTQITRDQLVAALQAAINGLLILHPSELASLAPEAALTSAPLAELSEALTPREREVLQMLATGLANKEIAAKLSISDHTVKFHVASILGKLGASTRTEAVTLAIRRGLILL